MIGMVRWPDEFSDPTPVVPFGPEFLAFIEELNVSGTDVSADEHWMAFAFSNDQRMVDFIHRGRLGRGKPHCWEVRLISDVSEIWLGQLFGIREYACVVTEGFEHVRTVTEMWLGGSDVTAIVAKVPFWDRMSPCPQLFVPETNDTQAG